MAQVCWEIVRAQLAGFPGAESAVGGLADLHLPGEGCSKDDGVSASSNSIAES